VLRFIRTLAGAGRSGEHTDTSLLERFATAKDPAAFARLVERHGPMVLAVCNRVLHDAHAAEDAFQATFLVLVRKAGSLGRPDRLGPWLYGVACRVAARARVEACKRRVRERPLTDVPAGDPADERVWHDLRPVLDEEVNRLPEKFRAAVVLCYLEGRTCEEAARALGCPRGTILSRLARARQRLRSRLLRRGVSLTAGALAALLSQKAAAAAVPAALAEATARAAPLFASGQALAGGAISARAAALTKGELRAMFWTTWKSVAAVVLVLGVAAGAALTYRAPATEPARADRPKQDRDRIQGTWVAVSGEADGQELPDEFVKKFKIVFAGDKITLRGYGKAPGAEKEVQGTYKLDPATKPPAIDITINDKESAIGIYELKGDTLKLCMIEANGNARPGRFAGKDKAVLMVLKRKK
jgi:RNA polymerase sigma factor (sigma-70 family)